MKINNKKEIQQEVSVAGVAAVASNQGEVNRPPSPVAVRKRLSTKKLKNIMKNKDQNYTTTFNQTLKDADRIGTSEKGAIKALKIASKKTGNKQAFKTHKKAYVKAGKEELRARRMDESILDTYNKDRSFVFDTKDGKMAPEVRKYILDFVEEWRASLPVKFELRYVRMIGSMTGYQYNPTSDIDINIMSDLDNKKIWTARKLLPNGHNYPDTNHEIGFWIGGKDDVYNEDNAENIYDLIEDKWIKQTERTVRDVPEEYVLEMSRFFMHGLDAVFGEYDRDVEDFKRLKGLDPEKQEITHKEKRERIIIKSQEIKADGDGIEMARNLIFAMMRDGYDDEKRPISISIKYHHGKEDKRFTVNNLIFKTIDRYGYIDRLNEYRKNFRELKKEIDIEIQKEIPEGSR